MKKLLIILASSAVLFALSLLFFFSYIPSDQCHVTDRLHYEEVPADAVITVFNDKTPESGTVSDAGTFDKIIGLLKEAEVWKHDTTLMFGPGPSAEPRVFIEGTDYFYLVDFNIDTTLLKDYSPETVSDKGLLSISVLEHSGEENYSTFDSTFFTLPKEKFLTLYRLLRDYSASKNITR